MPKMPKITEKTQGAGLVDLRFRGQGWRLDAACSGSDPELFFPDPSDGQAQAAALRVCDGCPVAVDCLVDALAVETPRQIRYGIRGGTTPADRAGLPSLDCAR